MAAAVMHPVSEASPWMATSSISSSSDSVSYIDDASGSPEILGPFKLPVQIPISRARTSHYDLEEEMLSHIPSRGPASERVARPPVAPAQHRQSNSSVPQLAEQLQHPSAGVRRNTAIALGRLGEAAARRGLTEVVLEHRNTLSDLHEDESTEVRQAAAFALGHLRDAAEIHSRTGDTAGNFSKASGSLMRTASDGAIFSDGFRERIRGHTWKTGLRPLLAEIMARHRFTRRSYQELIEDEMNEVLEVLKKSKSPTWAIKEESCKLDAELEHADAGVRASAVLSLGRLGPAGEAHAGHIQQRLYDNDAFVRAASAVTLGQASQVSGPDKDMSGQSGLSGSLARIQGQLRHSASTSSTGKAGKPRWRPASACDAGRLSRSSASGSSGRMPRPASAGAVRPVARPSSPALARGGRLRSRSRGPC